MKSAYLLALTALLSTIDVASAAWQKLPAVRSSPVNVSSESIVGAKVVSASGISNSQSLLTDDPAQFAKLSSGNSSAVIDISDQTMVNFVSFINEGATGIVSVSASTNNSDWVELSKQPFDGSTRLVELMFAGIQAKYVKVSFNLTKAGSLSSLKLLGSSKISDYLPQTVKRQGKGASSTGVGIDGTKPVYMFPNPEFFGELENGQASYKFPNTNEKYRTIIYDLGDMETLGKFSAAYSKVPTRVEIFVFEQLPEKKDWRGKTTFDPSILDTTKPFAVSEDAKGLGFIDINTKAVKTKYVVMRFEPNYVKGVAGLNFDLKSIASAALIPFSGIANQLGLLDLSPSLSRSVSVAAPGEFVVLNTKMTSNSSEMKVYISKSAIAKMIQQMAPGTTELQAINAILNKAGFQSVTDSQPGNGSAPNSGGPSGEDVADPALSNALSGFGLSAYRNGGTGGIGGGGSGTPPSNSNNNSSNNGSNAPIVIITTVNPASP
ncbi:hypothetical protein BH11VER1_BH11VER1_13220 [soil metagenome]